MSDTLFRTIPPRIFTWHIHGSYLYYLAQANCQIYIPKRTDDTPGYSGRSGDFAWPDNVIEIPDTQVKDFDFDLILFQTRRNYEKDQYRTLCAQQRALPQIYLEHDPPQEHPTNTKHWFQNAQGHLVHVTHFNNLMWDSGIMPTTVIDHGVTPTEARYTGELERGLVVVNNIQHRGRRLGLDLFQQLRQHIPLDLVGLGSKALGGLGEIPLTDLPTFSARYRFFFNPIRYTSLPLAICEAMTIGLPIVAFATTELATVITNESNGYTHTDPARLRQYMRRLLDDPSLAHQLSQGARQTAHQRFSIDRFTRDWENLFSYIMRTHTIKSEETIHDSI